MVGLIDRTVWALLRWIRESVVKRRRRRRARSEPDLDAYVDDLEDA